MAMPVERTQSKTFAALGLATLALALSLWWALNTYLIEDDAKVQRAVGQGFDPLEFEEPPEKEAAKAVPQPPALGTTRSGAEKPPQRILPEAVEPPAVEDPEVDRSGGTDLPFDEEEKRAPPGDHGTASDTSRFAGAVGRTAATATREVEVLEGSAWIGSTQRWVEGLIGARGVGAYPGLAYEAPRHTVRMERYFIDRFEVPNHRYFTFLRESASVVYDTSNFEPRTLRQIAQVLIRHPPANLDWERVTAQLFHSNRLALLSAFSGLVVTDREGVIDEAKTLEQISGRLVKPGVRLNFYERAPPGPWPSMEYLANHGEYPVRDISLEEALAFASWDGHHIPSEIEWEYAARGPRGSLYPWEGAARLLGKVTNGGAPLERDTLPRPIPVSHLPGGLSWVGCFNLLGNVSEWTSSFLLPYPGALEALPSRMTKRTNLVVRGGAAKDEDGLLLRSAFRGWPVGEPEGGPRPNQRLAWTGFRTARYHEIGRSRLPIMQYVPRRDLVLNAEIMDPYLYEAWQGTQVQRFVHNFGDAQPRPGVKALVANPLRVMARPTGGVPTHVGNGNPALADLKLLHALSHSSGPILFGLFHTDLHVVSTWHEARHGLPPLAAPEQLRRAVCPPGTWFVALLHGRLALVRSDLGDVFYVGNRAAPKSTVNVLERRSRSGTELVPKVALRYAPGQPEVEVRLEVPALLGEGPSYAAIVNVRLEVDARQSVLVLNWERGRRTRRP